MDIFNHLAYNTTGKEVDKAFSRCNYCRFHPHSCIHHFMLAKVKDEKYIHVSWCRKKPKEKENKTKTGDEAKKDI